jgi:hypothetical protein
MFAAHGPAYPAAQSSLRVILTIVPYYERRGIGPKAGDVLDLDGSGWELGTAAVLVAGEPRQGMVRRREPGD